MIVRNLRGASLLRHKCHPDRGAAAVEMAIVLLILILFVFGIIDFSRIFNAEIQISQAAREGARIAALADGSATGYTATNVTDRAVLAAPRPGFGVTPPQVPFIQMCGTGGQTLAKVTVTYAYTGILFSFTGSKELSQTAVMVCGG